MSEIVSADVIYLKSIVLYRLHMVLLLLLRVLRFERQVVEFDPLQLPRELKILF
jgi:hypothetical protein